MIADPLSKHSGILEKIERRKIDLSNYVEYKNQEYSLTVKDICFEISSPPDIDVKILKKDDASPVGDQIFDGDNLKQSEGDNRSSEQSKHKFLQVWEII